MRAGEGVTLIPVLGQGKRRRNQAQQEVEQHQISQAKWVQEGWVHCSE